MCGSSIPILGLQVTCRESDIVIWLTEDKAQKWANSIRTSLNERKLAPGDAATLGGRLGFGLQCTWQKLGRAMIRPIFQAARGLFAHREAGDALEMSLLWWKTLLEELLQRALSYKVRTLQGVEIFTDARSTPPRLAAVIVADGRVWWTEYAPTDAEMSQLISRGDNQILALEVFAVLLGVRCKNKIYIYICIS